MAKVSRRSLAKYAADQLAAGTPADKIAKQLAGVLLETGRAGETEFLAGDIAWELEHRGLLASAKITSATQLSEELQKHVKKQVQKVTGASEVALESKVDKSVVGGLRVQTSTRIWDTTVKRKLTELRESI